MTEKEKLNDKVIEAAGGILWRETGDKKEVAVIHRPRYDDWTLPKGKRESGETWQETAIREVIEETGCGAILQGFAGSVSYTVDGVAKIILFWNMIADCKGEFEPNDEVDQLVWLPLDQAIHKVSYDSEKKLLSPEGSWTK